MTEIGHQKKSTRKLSLRVSGYSRIFLYDKRPQIRMSRLRLNLDEIGKGRAKVAPIGNRVGNATSSGITVPTTITTERYMLLTIMLEVAAFINKLTTIHRIMSLLLNCFPHYCDNRRIILTCEYLCLCY